jgi:hypothetical protein
MARCFWPSERLAAGGGNHRRLWLNMPIQRGVGAGLTVRRARVDGAPVPTAVPDPTTLVLKRPVGAGERVTVSMRWTLRMPQTPTERLSAL